MYRMSFSHRLVGILLLLSFLVLPILLPVSAAESYNNLQFDTFTVLHDQAEDPITKAIQNESMIENTGASWVYSIVCWGVVGCSKKARLHSYQKSALGQMAGLTGTIISNPPARFAYWVQDTGQALGFLHPAYAQGTGFTGLQPLMELWKVFRNAAYLLLALALIILGFMIMFRRKIDPKTVVTVQNSLPRVIMVLILITFSYAIAGLLIDLMYILIFLVATLFSPYVRVDAATLFQQYSGAQGILPEGIPGLGAFNNLFAPLGMFQVEQTAAITGAAAGIGAIFGGVNAIPGAILGYLFANIVASVSGTTPPGGFWSPILWLIFAVALLFTFFRIFFMLITAYIQVLIAVIVGPLQILLDVFPGTNGFMSWLMGIVGNLLTFLLVSVLMLIMAVVMNTVGTANFWTPPFVGSVNPGLLKAIIGVGGMVLIPTLVSNLKQALKMQSAIPLGAGTALGPIGAVGGMSLGTLSQFYYAKQILSGPISSIRKGLGQAPDDKAKPHGR